MNSQAALWGLSLGIWQHDPRLASHIQIKTPVVASRYNVGSIVFRKLNRNSILLRLGRREPCSGTCGASLVMPTKKYFGRDAFVDENRRTTRSLWRFAQRNPSMPLVLTDNVINPSPRARLPIQHILEHPYETGRVITVSKSMMNESLLRNRHTAQSEVEREIGGAVRQCGSKSLVSSVAQDAFRQIGITNWHHHQAPWCKKCLF